MPNAVCSFTGHRTIPDAHRATLPTLLRRAIAYAYGEGCRDFCTGGALGFDTMAAREVLLFRLQHSDVRLLLYLPCVDQDGKWHKKEQDAYRYLLGMADEVHYIENTYTPDCMRRRNQCLADVCDMMIAYVGHTRSGAAQTVSMAKRLGKPVYNLYTAADTPGAESPP